MDLFVRQRWVEPRLDLPEDVFEEGDDFVTLPANFFDNLWHPDPYILNAKASGTKQHRQTAARQCRASCIKHPIAGVPFSIHYYNFFFRDCNFDAQILQRDLVQK